MIRLVRRSGTVLLVMLFWLSIAVFAAYAPQDAAPPQQAGRIEPQQLDDLVAPIALYPDPLVAEVLAACTYPMEIAEAEQWVRDHPNWRPAKLADKAKKENWDPSVQGLVAFRDVLDRLTQDMRWTTQLGNAFLAQQADVMQAIQRMRSRTESDGRLHSTPQETIATGIQDGRSVITIDPADPDVWYVPNYNPAYVWGPPVWGAYPPLVYPGIGAGLGWYPGIDIGLYFGGWGGWGWGGWGWTPNWYAGGIYTDHSFFHRYGFRHYGGGGLLGNSPWIHSPEHRLGLPYSNPEVARRFALDGARGSAGGRPPGFVRDSRPQDQRFGGRGFEERGWTGNHSVFGGYRSGSMTRMQSDRGFSSMGAGRSLAGGMHTSGMRIGGGAPGGGARGGGRR